MIKITKKGKKSWVTFTVKSMAKENISICGEWNNWKDEPMKKKKNGDSYITKILTNDDKYQFGYHINNEWKHDEQTKSVDTPFGSKNSVLEC